MTGDEARYRFPAHTITDPAATLDARLADLEERLEYARDVITRIAEQVSQLRAEIRA